MLLPILILLLPGMKPERNNGEYLSRNTCSNLKGLAAVMVVIGHLFNDDSTKFPPTVFCQFGTMAVGLFFFISGYGYADKDLTFRYLKRKIIDLWLPVLLISPVYYLCYNYITPYGNGQYDGLKVFESMLRGNPLVRVSWYTTALSFLLIALALSKALCRKGSSKSNAMFWCFMVIAYQMYITVVFVAGYGRWWIYTPHMFILGIIWKRHEAKLKALLYRYVVVFLPFL